jgi:hypothetical protein
VGHNLDTADLGNFQFDHFAAFEAVIIAFTQALAGLGWKAVRCEWTFGGAEKTPIGCERTRRGWSACNPTSS